eukprot:283301-Alexandrium_andersonii.AAC.1
MTTIATTSTGRPLAVPAGGWAASLAQRTCQFAHGQRVAQACRAAGSTSLRPWRGAPPGAHPPRLCH